MRTRRRQTTEENLVNQTIIINPVIFSATGFSFAESVKKSVQIAEREDISLLKILQDQGSNLDPIVFIFLKIFSGK